MDCPLAPNINGKLVIICLVSLHLHASVLIRSLITDQWMLNHRFWTITLKRSLTLPISSPANRFVTATPKAVGAAIRMLRFSSLSPAMLDLLSAGEPGLRSLVQARKSRPKAVVIDLVVQLANGRTMQLEICIRFLKFSLWFFLFYHANFICPLINIFV